jgi:hypothetical protein
VNNKKYGKGQLPSELESLFLTWKLGITRTADDITTKHSETKKVNISEQNFYKGKYKPVIPE